MVAPVVLCILDGWGLSEVHEGNAPVLAKTPNFDRIMAECPNARLVTFGPDVGLPKGQMGNSEVGHMNIGAGRVVAMDLGQIDLSIEDGSFPDLPAIEDFARRVDMANGRAHLMAVVSDGGVHGHIEHLIAAAETLTNKGLKVVVHAITDGRDVGPKTADRFVADLEARLPKGAKIATVVGRYFALDRDQRWERVSAAYESIVLGRGHRAESASLAISEAYARGETDEFIQPTTLDGMGMGPGDGVFCLNFRSDRAREIMSAIGDVDFDAFDREYRPDFSIVMGMAEYSDHHNTFMSTVFPKRSIVNTLGAWVAGKGKRQFRLAETEKYPHVTFFLNGGKEVPERAEDRFMPPSPKVATYDLQPEMSAADVTAQLVDAISADYDLIVVNFANPDMVGHTGDLEAAMKACEAVDAGLGQALAALQKKGGAMIVTADHGNCETMIDPETGGPHTAHTLNLVPVALVGGPENAKLRDGRLADLAPTVLQLMEVDVPPEMTGKSLII